MDILNYILLGVRVIQEIIDHTDKNEIAFKNEQLNRLEKLTFESKIKYSSTTIDDKLNRVAIVLKGIWELVKNNSNLTDYDLNQKIIELDIEDGKLDGKISKKIMKCTNCGAGISMKFKKCQICGKEYPEISDTDFL